MLFRTNQLVTLNMTYLRTSRFLHVFFSEVLPSYNFIIVSFLMLLSRFYRDKLMKLKISRIYINNVIFSFSFNEYDLASKKRKSQKEKSAVQRFGFAINA